MSVSLFCPQCYSIPLASDCTFTINNHDVPTSAQTQLVGAAEKEHSHMKHIWLKDLEKTKEKFFVKQEKIKTLERLPPNKGEGGLCCGLWAWIHCPWKNKTCFSLVLEIIEKDRLQKNIFRNRNSWQICLTPKTNIFVFRIRLLT